jgi:hypothetical protein
MVLIRLFASEPVREWMAEFKRLHTVREEPAEQNILKEPEQTMRVKRAKTRAAAVSGQEVAGSCTGLPENSRQVAGISTEIPKNVS